MHGRDGRSSWKATRGRRRPFSEDFYPLPEVQKIGLLDPPARGVIPQSLEGAETKKAWRQPVATDPSARHRLDGASIENERHPPDRKCPARQVMLLKQQPVPIAVINELWCVVVVAAICSVHTADRWFIAQMVSRLSDTHGVVPFLLAEEVL